MDKFELVSEYKMMGDQPEAVARLKEGLEDGLKYQTLMGVTGSGKTFTMANLIAQVNRPTLVISLNSPWRLSFTVSSRSFSRTMR